MDLDNSLNIMNVYGGRHVQAVGQRTGAEVYPIALGQRAWVQN